MIIKTVKGRGAAPLLQYLELGKSGEKRGEIIAGNMAGRDADELAKEFRVLAAQRPDVRRNVLHIILATPAEDRVDAAKQRLIARRFARDTGLEETMWIAIRHKDHAHDEIHIVASRVKFDRRVVDDSWDYMRYEQIARQIEIDMGLTRTAPSRTSMRRAPTRGEILAEQRTGHTPMRKYLQDAIDDVLTRQTSEREFIAELARRGIRVHLRRDGSGATQGISYSYGDAHYSGSALGRAYSWPGLYRIWPRRRGRLVRKIERGQDICERARQRTHAIVDPAAYHALLDRMSTRQTAGPHQPVTRDRTAPVRERSRSR